MNRRELLSKIGLAAMLPMAAVSGMAIEPKVPEGQWLLNGMPICPECHMAMDQSRLRSENGQVLIHHPKGHPDWHEWKCKNAGKTFVIPTVGLQEYRGKLFTSRDGRIIDDPEKG